MSYEEGSAYIHAGDIDQRIEELERQEDLTDEEEDELSAMLHFRIHAKNALHVWEPDTSFIRESFFSEHAEGEATDLYGQEVVESGYFMLVKWTEDRKAEFTEIRYGSTSYLGDGR